MSTADEDGTDLHELGIILAGDALEDVPLGQAFQGALNDANIGRKAGG